MEGIELLVVAISMLLLAHAGVLPTKLLVLAKNLDPQTHNLSSCHKRIFVIHWRQNANMRGRMKRLQSASLENKPLNKVEEKIQQIKK